MISKLHTLKTICSPIRIPEFWACLFLHLGMTLSAQENILAPQVVESPEPSFIVQALSSQGSKKRVSVSWSAHPVPGLAGIHKVVISSPSQWEKAFLVVEGRPVALFTPEMLRKQNKERREKLDQAQSSSKVNAVRGAVSVAEESRGFLWNFGERGKPSDLNIVVYTANGSIGVGE